MAAAAAALDSDSEAEAAAASGACYRGSAVTIMGSVAGGGGDDDDDCIRVSAAVPAAAAAKSAGGDTPGPASLTRSPRLRLPGSGRRGAQDSLQAGFQACPEGAAAPATKCALAGGREPEAQRAAAAAKSSSAAAGAAAASSADPAAGPDRVSHSHMSVLR